MTNTTISGLCPPSSVLSYPVHVGRDLIDNVGSLVQSRGRTFVITSTALRMASEAAEAERQLKAVERDLPAHFRPAGQKRR